MNNQNIEKINETTAVENTPEIAKDPERSDLKGELNGDNVNHDNSRIVNSNSSIHHCKYMSSENPFNILSRINVNADVEEKNGLRYLSWPFAWAEIKKRYPKATYRVLRFGEKQLPYICDEDTGYMVFTEASLDGVEFLEMSLPVLDSANRPLKNSEYSITTKYGNKTITIPKASMFDINKAHKRCLTKNFAMFGLGLYIYAGEDLPEDTEKNIDYSKQNFIDCLERLEKEIKSFGENSQKIREGILKKYNAKELVEMEKTQIVSALNRLKQFRNTKGGE